jgi:hypothetical protein
MPSFIYIFLSFFVYNSRHKPTQVCVVQETCQQAPILVFQGTRYVFRNYLLRFPNK